MRFLADRRGVAAQARAPRSTTCSGRMHELAMILRGAADSTRGALELNMPEVKVDLDADGRVTGAHVVENTESHQIIEEFMLAANEAVAEMLARQGPAVPPPRPRVARARTSSAA